MRLLRAIFKHQTKMVEHHVKVKGEKKPKHQGPPPHHTGTKIEHQSASKWEGEAGWLKK